MAEMMQFRKQRGLIKAKMTRLQTKFNQISEDQMDSEEGEVFLSRLEDIWGEFQRIQREIVANTDGEPTVAETTEENEFEERYFDIKIKLKRLLNNIASQRTEAQSFTSNEMMTHALQQQNEFLKHLSDAQGSGNSDAFTQLLEQQTQILRSIADSSGLSSLESKVKLPVVNLPTFEGKSEEWKRFSETFLSLVHNNETLPNIQKFQYLVTSLSGNAAKVIESIELTDANYNIAWQLLKKRYDDPQSIKKKHIQCLFTMPKVDKESAVAIRELVDYTLKHLRILKSFDLPTESWDELIVHMLEAKLDAKTSRTWELTRTDNDTTLEDLTKFLENRCQKLERIEARRKENEKNFVRKGEGDKSKSRVHHMEKTTTLASSTKDGKCYLCRGEHFLYQCEKFLSAPIEDRIKEVLRLKLCINCLRNDHFVKTCKMGSCRECSGRHNTLCHRSTTDKMKEDESSKTPKNLNSNEKASMVAVHHAGNSSKRHTLLATAVVNATHQNGSIVTLRILLDSASEAHFITHAACNKLGVKRNRAHEIITGIGEIEGNVRQCCNVNIRSRHSNVRTNIRGFIVSKITKMLPCTEINFDALDIPENIKLADPEFYRRNSIDMLIGAEYFYDWLRAGKIELGNNRPILQNTCLGWIVAGSFSSKFTTDGDHNRDTLSVLTCSLEHDETLNTSLNRFWEVEGYRTTDECQLSVREKECEEFVEKTITRNEDGRFVVRLPFSKNPKILGESREIANKRLLQLERRLERDSKFREGYTAFMRDYLRAGHMSLITKSEKIADHSIVYLPHHGVIKESSSSTRLRVVFDASSKTSSGKSLNDILYIGPAMQGNLIEIVLRFRLYRIALTSDIKQMYRQIQLHDEDRDCQRILWRFSVNEPIKEFKLNTVTFGQSSSPYLAMKCIRKLAVESESEFPSASQVLSEQTYVDDILAGADSPAEATLLQEQLTTILKSGGFETHKWCSNNEEVLAKIPSHIRENTCHPNIGATETIKTLGLQWNPQNDQFQFSIQGIEGTATKRGILSTISKIFDPLGLIGPIITTAKIIMQETWRTECQWDEVLPESLVTRWNQFCKDLNNTNALCIPRCIVPGNKMAKISLQGFCDASEHAYGACLYFQTEDKHGIRTSNLLCSKSRVAPIKRMSIPRLELCGAVLLAHLITNVQKALKVPIHNVRAWTDSQVVLWWIHGEPSKWKSFVAHRVSEINGLLPAQYWSHVRGTDNPADMISRGTTLQQLRKSNIWWSGPSWMQEEIKSDVENIEDFKPTIEIKEKIQEETRKSRAICALVNSEESILQELIERYSSITKTERVLAYCLRFLRNLSKPSKERELTKLSVSELNEAHFRLIKYIQAKEFGKEIEALRNTREIKINNRILQLRPFIDDQGILRVGGRLHYAPWEFDRKHPILLPATGRFSKLLFEREHRRLMHAGQQLLLTSIREKYWPLRGRDLARRVVHECVRCFKAQPPKLHQLMGALPQDRVTPSRAFAIVGVDFAGPLTTLVNRGRNRKTLKSYIAIFVCFSTRAIHLEVTSELSSAAFLATIRRFVSRRGRPLKIYSDNATNFVGANRELKELYQFIKIQVEGNLGDELSNEGIEWQFIPPYSPHMGGLWEAGVKSCKFHLKRMMGNSMFTFEELTTALSQIEACLNSRPLSPISMDPTDMQALTPAHFLVGGPLTSIPDRDVTDCKLNRLDRWQLIQRVVQDFWKRWAKEYIANLQNRSKWKQLQVNLQLNDLVLLRDENRPPLSWKLGRVIELHPGHDGLVRVVTVRTETGNSKRSIVKLCKLPLCSD